MTRKNDSISIKELFEKYQELVTENINLKEEIRALKAQLGIVDARIPSDEISGNESEPEMIGQQSAGEELPPGISNSSDAVGKIRLFMSLFKGRDDVYAKRWESKQKDKSGYAPSCMNEWKAGLCAKPKGTCAGCAHKAYSALDEIVIQDHLLGKVVAGIYPMRLDETCCFLVIDFDDGEWQKDTSALRDVCAEFAMVVNEMRNQLIVDDVVNSHESGRNCLVLTERINHVELLAGKLRERIPEVMTLRGGRGTKEAGEILKRISDTPADKQLTLVATGRYIGEGFDEPRLDTLFLTMPISWKGTLQQYAGRLHRLFENKNEVQIYDYVDIHVSVLERMYNKRLNGYASIGYKANGGGVEADSIDVIFDKSSFLPVYNNDIVAAEREILIVSPFVTRRRTLHMMQHLEVALRNKVRVIVVTRPIEDFGGKDPAALQRTLDLLQGAGVSVVFRPNIHQKFALIDQRIVWYGSINLLSFGSAEESIMRLESPNIASELIKSVTTPFSPP